ncbi:hypothetical protein [Tuwongella immobilis]|uniref:: DUF2846 n=1 Tax=Tuwongella immobilis TaxID=692036 RepID=A0A6C2YRG9_9BACT|nr:hypothetical protein [Tuwongella immobilis]VIP03713.1 : DUF2846 [Tuwongella immobilis]VTS04794.1 : DUF2846 [Tuwongella immobilis]
MPHNFRDLDSRLLKTLCIFFAAGFGTKLGVQLFRREESLSDTVGNFFSDFVMPYCYGAFGSDFALIWLAATLFAILFALALRNRGQHAAETAKRSLWIIYLLSLFTLWLEPFISVSAAVGGALMALAKIPMKFVDLGLSVFWFIILMRANAEIDQKIAGTSSTATSRTSESDRTERPASTTAGSRSSSREPIEDAMIVLNRPWSMNQALYAVNVFVDQISVGKLKNGKSLHIPVTPGSHQITLKYFLFTVTIDVEIRSNETITFKQTFGTWIASPRLERVKQAK